MDFPELRKANAPLAQQIDQVLAEAGRLKALEGARRLSLVSRHYKKFSVEQAYHLIDPDAFQHEIEQVRTHAAGLGFLRLVRNVAALLPLIMTWIALSIASSKYSADLSNPLFKDKDQYISFLLLWQSGFHGTDMLTFSTTAIIDVVLLSVYLCLVAWVTMREGNIHRISSQFSNNLQSVVEKLCDLISTNTTSMISDAGIDRIIVAIEQASTNGIKEIAKTIKQVTTEGVQEIVDAFEPIADADVQRIVDAIKIVVADALLVSKQVADQAKVTMEDLFDGKMEPMINSFHKDLGTLNMELTKLTTRLTDYTKQVEELTRASTKIATNASDLKDSASAYTGVSKDIRDQIVLLNGTQQQVVSQIHSVATNMDGTAKAAEKVADKTNDVAEKLVITAQQDIATMAGRVISAAQELARVANVMAQINSQLQNTNSQIQATPGRMNQQLQGSLSQVDAHLQSSINKVSLGLTSSADQLQAAAKDLGDQIVQAQNIVAAIGANNKTRGRGRGQPQVVSRPATGTQGQVPKNALPKRPFPWPWNWGRRGGTPTKPSGNTKP